MNLSPHFTFDELTRTSQTALQAKNRAEAQAFLPSLTELAALLEVIRVHFGKPLKINSGFRGASVNAGTPGSSKTSQHMKGEAADIEIPGVDDAELHRWADYESVKSLRRHLRHWPAANSARVLANNLRAMVEGRMP